MTVPCGTSTEELREAFFLNLNAATCLKLALGNARLLMITCVFLVAMISQIVTGKGDLRLIMIFAGLVALTLGVMWLGLTRSLRKRAKAMSAAGGQMSIDAQGITTILPNGTRTFVPWSAFARWREGKLVFTIGNGKSYSTISKSALGIYAGDFRSMLLSQVRTATN